MSASDPAVGFIGLGEQGNPLALNLHSAGYAPIVFDSRPAALQPFTEARAEIASSVEEVGRRATVTLVCVADDTQLASVLAEPGGLVRSMCAGGLIVVHSTVSPGAIRDAAELAASADLMLVDAPLTGGAAGAASKSVVYFVGGKPEAIERCRPLLEVSARKIICAGPVGAGVRAKLVHQLVLCGNIVAARDGWSLGQRAGLDIAVILDVLQSGAAQSRVAERLPHIEWSPHVMGLFQKDVSLCLELGSELALNLPTAALAQMELMVNKFIANERSTENGRPR